VSYRRSFISRNHLTNMFSTAVIQDELVTAMKLVGITSLSQVSPDLVNTRVVDHLIPTDELSYHRLFLEARERALRRSCDCESRRTDRLSDHSCLGVSLSPLRVGIASVAKLPALGDTLKTISKISKISIKRELQ
jgi:hypothetical protein